jgi:hypothetical protein
MKTPCRRWMVISGSEDGIWVGSFLQYVLLSLRTTNQHFSLEHAVKPLSMAILQKPHIYILLTVS